jgi:hypothetical protein
MYIAISFDVTVPKLKFLAYDENYFPYFEEVIVSLTGSMAEFEYISIPPMM